MRWIRSVITFIEDSIEALAFEETPPKNTQLEFDFEKEKRRWHEYLRPP